MKISPASRIAAMIISRASAPNPIEKEEEIGPNPFKLIAQDLIKAINSKDEDLLADIVKNIVEFNKEDESEED